MKPASERRSYYRITDVVGLSYSVLGENEKTATQATQNLDMPVASLLSEIDREFNQASNILWQESPVVAKALGLLNKKLSVVAAHSLAALGVEDATSYDELVISVSASGLGFDSPQQIPAGQQLSLSLSLKPSNITLELTGTVTGCDRLANLAEESYWVRVNFDADNETAIEQLTQHVVQRQFAQVGEVIPETAIDRNTRGTP